MDENLRRYLVVGAICSVIALWGFLTYSQHRSIQSMQEEEEQRANEMAEQIPSMPAVDQPPTPAAQLDKLQQERKVRELAQRCKEWLDTENGDKFQAALQRYPNAVQSEFNERLRLADYAGARALITEFRDVQSIHITRDADVYSSWRYTRENLESQWRQTSLRWATDTLRTANPELADTVCRRFWDDELAELPVREYLPFKMKLFRAARAAGRAEEAERHLREAAEVSLCDDGGSNRDRRSTAVEEALAKEFTPEQLLEEGTRRLKSNDKADAVTAMCFLMAYREPDKPLPRSQLERQELFKGRLDRKLLAYEALLNVCRDAIDGKLRWLRIELQGNRLEILLYTPQSVAREIEQFDKVTEDPLAKFRIPHQAWMLRFRLYERKAERLLAAEQYSSTRQFVDTVLRQELSQFVQFSADSLKDDVWNDLPPEVQARLEPDRPDANSRRMALFEAMRAEVYTPPFPGKAKLIECRMIATARDAIMKLKQGNHGQAYAAFRDVLRQFPKHTAALEVRDALVDAIRTAEQKRDFNALYSHAGFFIGELASIEMAQDIRDFLAQVLNTAAEHFKQDGSAMKQVFMLSLLADVLGPDEEGGRLAAAQAMTLGLAAVAALKGDTPTQPDLVRPSNLDGLSVLGLENGTPYHLLAFFDGPEKFFVRFNPFRRGCVVLRSGHYLRAVVVTSDEVRPYKGEWTYIDQYASHRYVVVVEGQSQAQDRRNPAEMLGDYSLLRVPPGGHFNIDPATGLITQK